MKSPLLFIVIVLASATIGKSQGQPAPAARPLTIGVGLTSMSGYYSGTNESVDGVKFAPTLTARFAFSPRVALQSGYAFQKIRENRDESSPTQRYIEAKKVNTTVVPLLLRVALGRTPHRLSAAFLGGLTFMHSNIDDRRTYFYTTTYTTDIVIQEINRVEKRTAPFLSGGVALAYQATPRLVAQADCTLNGNLGGGKSQYYEYLPSGWLQFGVGYCLGKVRP